jgi:hypothetical protein
MATYKVLQDIEAEDKLVGPLSLRQFIYAAIAVVSGFIAFKLVTVNVFLIAPFLPIVILFGVLAAPFGHDQPSEVWLLARVRFFLKPHRRIWNQSGMVNLVTITAPKKIQRNLTKNLTQTEVSSRLKALANTIDSRGWAIKNVNVNLYNQSSGSQMSVDSDRLINPLSLPQDVPTYDVSAADDMLDPQSNPTAQHLDQMIVSATQQYHQQIVDKMNDNNQPDQNGNTPTPDYWFMNDSAGQTQPTNSPPGYATFTDDQIVAPGADPAAYSPTSQPYDDAALLEQFERNKDISHNNYGHMRVIEPLSEQARHKKHPAQPAVKTPVTTVTDPAIINLALENKDNWSVATIAHQAEEAKKKQPPQDEVIISLH